MLSMLRPYLFTRFTLKTKFKKDTANLANQFQNKTYGADGK